MDTPKLSNTIEISVVSNELCANETTDNVNNASTCHNKPITKISLQSFNKVGAGCHVFRNTSACIMNHFLEDKHKSS